MNEQKYGHELLMWVTVVLNMLFMTLNMCIHNRRDHNIHRVNIYTGIKLFTQRKQGHSLSAVNMVVNVCY